MTSPRSWTRAFRYSRTAYAFETWGGWICRVAAMPFSKSRGRLGGSVLLAVGQHRRKPVSNSAKMRIR